MSVLTDFYFIPVPGPELWPSSTAHGSQCHTDFAQERKGGHPKGDGILEGGLRRLQGSEGTLLQCRLSHEVLAKGLMQSFKEADVKAGCSKRKGISTLAQSHYRNWCRI